MIGGWRCGSSLTARLGVTYAGRCTNEILMASLFLPDAESLGLEQARQRERKRGAMRIIAYAVPAFVACAFFLFVAIQFHRDETRPRRGVGARQAAPPAGRVVELAAASTEQRKSGGEPNSASREKPPRASQLGVGPTGKGMRAREQGSNGNPIPYIEMMLPVAAVVTPVRDSVERAHNSPPRRIA